MILAIHTGMGAGSSPPSPPDRAALSVPQDQPMVQDNLIDLTKANRLTCLHYNLNR